MKRFIEGEDRRQVTLLPKCTGGERLRLSVSPGTYGVLALFSGLDTISEDGLEASDTYRVVVWPASSMPLSVLKAWDEV